MSGSRIALFKQMLAADAKNSVVRYGLANELLKLEHWEEASKELELYLAQTDDQGAAYGKLAQAFEKLGRIEEARTAYSQGIAAARKHGHPGLAQDFEMALSEML